MGEVSHRHSQPQSPTVPFDHHRDPFVDHFFSRIPADVAATFTAVQLDAVKRAFGARTPGAHTVDIRFSVPLVVRSVYVVVLAGSERRQLTRRAVERAFRPLWTVANTFVFGAFGLFAVLALAGVLYAVKAVLGIDIVPGVDMLPDATLKSWLR